MLSTHQTELTNALCKDLNMVESIDYIELFTTAVNNKLYNYASTILSTGLIQKFDSTNSAGPLIAAIKHEKLDLVKLLIDHGADINVGGLLDASLNLKDTRIIDLLIDTKGLDLNKVDYNGNSFLMRISFKSDDKYIDLVKKLVEKGCDLTIKNNYGNTALMRAIVNDNKKISKYLAKHTPNIEVININNETVLDNAIIYNNYSVAKILIQRGVVITKKYSPNDKMKKLIEKQVKKREQQQAQSNDNKIECIDTNNNKYPCLDSVQNPIEMIRQLKYENCEYRTIKINMIVPHIKQWENNMWVDKTIVMKTFEIKVPTDSTMIKVEYHVLVPGSSDSITEETFVKFSPLTNVIIDNVSTKLGDIYRQPF